METWKSRAANPSEDLSIPKSYFDEMSGFLRSNVCSFSHLCFLLFWNLFEYNSPFLFNSTSFYIIWCHTTGLGRQWPSECNVLVLQYQYILSLTILTISGVFICAELPPLAITLPFKFLKSDGLTTNSFFLDMRNILQTIVNASNSSFCWISSLISSHLGCVSHFELTSYMQHCLSLCFEKLLFNKEFFQIFSKYTAKYFLYLKQGILSSFFSHLEPVQCVSQEDSAIKYFHNLLQCKIYQTSLVWSQFSVSVKMLLPWNILTISSNAF